MSQTNKLYTEGYDTQTIQKSLHKDLLPNNLNRMSTYPFETEESMSTRIKNLELIVDRTPRLNLEVTHINHLFLF